MFQLRSPRALVALACAIAALLLAPALADEGKAAKKQKTDLAGQLVCVGCTLEKEHGAEAQCTLHAKHAQGFLAEDGTLYTLLDNGRGHILISDRKLAGAAIRLEAYTFPKTQVRQHTGGGPPLLHAGDV